MTLRSLLVCLLFASSASAQTIRTIALQPVFVTYQQNRQHWTDPATTGAQYIAQDNGFWHSAKASWGAITVTGTPYPNWVDSSQSIPTSCNNQRQVQMEADVTAVLGLVPPNTIRVLVLPPGSPCNSYTFGLASTGATIYVVAGGYLQHETGHALGLPHAPEQHCSAGAGVVSCSVQEYGSFSIMGSGTHGDGLRVSERKALNVYTSTYALSPAGGTQDVTLQISDTATPGLKGVSAPKIVTVPVTILVLGKPVVVMKREDHSLAVEMRKEDANTYGVIVEGGADLLLDLDRTSTTLRWYLHLGETVCDGSYWCVTLTRLDASTATVHVIVAP